MPNSPSAKKRLRQNVVRRARNRSIKSAVRSQLRKVREAIAAGDLEKSNNEFRLAVKKLDSAAADRVIHANAAARLKSRLNAKIKALAQAA
ncbi:MAG: 30S ribosomal protein S20 [Pirellulales bacterium]|nr:30S ribosomal protein S20 [Planctomycetales bacterium]